MQRRDSSRQRCSAAPGRHGRAQSRAGAGNANVHRLTGGVSKTPPVTAGRRPQKRTAKNHAADPGRGRIDKNLARQKPPFHATPAERFHRRRRADRPETGPKRTFLRRRRHKPAATTAPKAAETLAFSSRARARPREAPKFANVGAMDGRSVSRRRRGQTSCQVDGAQVAGTQPTCRQPD